MKKPIKKTTKAKKQPKKVDQTVPEYYKGIAGYWKDPKRELPKLVNARAVSETKSSKPVLVRWRFKNTTGKWKYGFGTYFETKKNICGPWWQVHGTTGITEISAWASIKKPILEK